MTLSRALPSAAYFLALVVATTVPAAAASLPALPEPAESFDSGSLHVDRYGDGARTLFFVPGLGSGPWSWAEQITRFSRSYRVYAITLNGFDGRPFVPQADPFASFAHDFWALLAQRAMTRPVVIGHSLGGTLAILLAEQHPERLSGAIALDGLPVFPTVAQQTAAQRAAEAAVAGAQIAAQSQAQLLAYELQYMKTVGTLDPALVEPSAALEARSDPHALASWLQADFVADLRPDLRSATLPLLELVPYAPGGPYTEEQTLSYYRGFFDGAPSVTLAPIRGAAHFAMLDQPGAVDAAIAQFLTAPPAPSASPRG